MWKIKRTRKKKFKKDTFLQTLNYSSKKKGKEKKNKTLQNTLRESFFLAEEERHAHLKHKSSRKVLRKEGDDDDEGRV